MAAISGSNAWAVGSWGLGALVMHWNGSRWSRVTVAGQASFYLTQVAASSAGNVWAFGNTNNGLAGVALRWDGSVWQRVPLPASAFPDAAAVLSGSDVWISGQQSCTGSGSAASCQTGMYRWNGSSWAGPYLVPALVNTISAAGDGLITDGQGGVWAGAWAHWTGHRWLGTVPGPSFAGNLNSFDLRGLARIPGRTTVWGVGEVSHSPTSSIWDTLIARYP